METSQQECFSSSVPEGIRCVQRTRMVAWMGCLIDIISMIVFAASFVALRRVTALIAFDQKWPLAQRIMSVIMVLGMAWWSQLSVLRELLLLCAAGACLIHMQTRMVKTNFATWVRIAAIALLWTISARTVHSSIVTSGWIMGEACSILITVIGISFL